MSTLRSIVAFVARLSGNSPQVKKFIAVFVALLVLSWATQCRGSELALETGSTYIRGETPALAVTLIFPKAGPIDTDFQCGVVLSGSSTYKGIAQRNNAALHCVMVDGFGKVDIGIGAGYLFATDAYNGSNVNFSLMLGYRFNERYSLVARHFSNLGTSLPNLGRDYALIQRKF